MQTSDALNQARRRRRIALVAILPIVAALVFWTLESGDWLVIYNDGPEPLAEINLQAGGEHWTLRDLEPRESRRLRVHSGEAVELTVDVTDWAPEPPVRTLFDWRYASVVTLRLDSSRTVTSTSESGIWQRALNW